MLQKELGNERIIYIKSDVSDEDAVKRAVEKTVKAFGTIHIALACAGIMLSSETLNKKGESLDMASFRKMINVNVMGSVYTAKYCAV